MHPAKLTFQALRIVLNQEFDEMRRGMHAAFDIMPEHGRLGILTWKHSECAIVVDFFATTKSSEKTSLSTSGRESITRTSARKSSTQVGFTHGRRPAPERGRDASKQSLSQRHAPIAFRKRDDAVRRPRARRVQAQELGQNSRRPGATTGDVQVRSRVDELGADAVAETRVY